MSNTPEVEKAIKEVFEKLENMSPKEFAKALKQAEEEIKRESEPVLDIGSVEFLRQT